MWWKVRLKLLLIALGLSAAFVFVGNAAADLVDDGRILNRGSLGFMDALDVAVMHVILAGLPFFTLAVLAEVRRNLWVAGAVVTGLLWIFVIWSVWRASRHEFSGGADIGLGMMMLFVPVIASIALAVVSLRSR